jgi:hypothetical protein
MNKITKSQSANNSISTPINTISLIRFMKAANATSASIGLRIHPRSIHGKNAMELPGNFMKIALLGMLPAFDAMIGTEGALAA